MTDATSRRRRCVLVAPGSDERKIRKALESGADEVVLDLEDAVAAANKDAARALVSRVLATHDTARHVAVRVNGIGTPWAADDLAAVGALDDVGVVLPKVNSAADLEMADRRLTALGAASRLQALIETPLGLRAVDEICAATNRLDGIIVGYADMGAELGRTAEFDPQRWLHVQDRVLIAARCAGVQAIDGPHLSIADDGELGTSCRWTRDLGFDGKWGIHPGQVASVTKIFTPTAESVDHARRVLAALTIAATEGAGAALLDGQMLDEAVAVAARRVVTQIGEPA